VGAFAWTSVDLTPGRTDSLTRTLQKFGLPVGQAGARRRTRRTFKAVALSVLAVSKMRWAPTSIPFELSQLRTAWPVVAGKSIWPQRWLFAMRMLLHEGGRTRCNSLVLVFGSSWKPVEWRQVRGSQIDSRHQRDFDATMVRLVSDAGLFFLLVRPLARRRSSFQLLVLSASTPLGPPAGQLFSVRRKFRGWQNHDDSCFWFSDGLSCDQLGLSDATQAHQLALSFLNETRCTSCSHPPATARRRAVSHQRSVRRSVGREPVARAVSQLCAH
jgi:hypothetical protein